MFFLYALFLVAHSWQSYMLNQLLLEAHPASLPVGSSLGLPPPPSLHAHCLNGSLPLGALDLVSCTSSLAPTLFVTTARSVLVLGNQLVRASSLRWREQFRGKSHWFWLDLASSLLIVGLNSVAIR